MGQVCYVYRGGVTFLQIKRLTGRQAAIGPGAATTTQAAAAPGAGADAGLGLAAEPPTVPLPVVGAVPGRPAWPMPGPALPDVSELLDEAFGERRE